MQVQASLGALHRTIDRAMSLDDQWAGRMGSATDSKEIQEEPSLVLKAQMPIAPAAANLVYA